MENIVLGDDFVRRDPQQGSGSGGLSLDNLPGGASDMASSLGAIVAPGATGTVSAIPITPIATITNLGSSSTSVIPQTTTVVSSTSPSSAASSSADHSSGGISSTTLIAILVPVCVLLAAVPTAAYLIYLRKRDKKQREEAEMLRGRGANSSSGATGEALLMRRSMSAASQHERKFASVSSAELELGAGGAALEKSISYGSYRHESGIFSPANHGPSRNRSQQTSMDSQRRPGFKPPPIASQSPTLPPLDFGKDDVSFSPLNTNTGNPGTVSTAKPTVPANLPTFAPTQAKQRAPNPALHPGRSGPSPAPGDAPSWPLPADGLRDSSSTYSSVATERPSPYQNKPLPPSSLNKEATQTSASAAVARQKQQQQRGPRESSIAYGVPPVPPSPEADHSFVPDRRSNVSRKRDSDAISELSYSASTRGRRDTRRDTDAISIVSALSQHDR